MCTHFVKPKVPHICASSAVVRNIDDERETPAVGPGSSTSPCARIFSSLADVPTSMSTSPAASSSSPAAPLTPELSSALCARPLPPVPSARILTINSSTAPRNL